MNALRTSIRVFFGYTANAAVTTTNPARLIRRARCGPALPKGLSDADQRRLLDAVGRATGRHATRDAALIRLMLGTGIRVGSALALEVRDVDLAAGEILLRRAKGDREARVFMSNTVRQHMRTFLKGRTAGPVFEGRPGRSLCSRQFAVRFAAWQRLAGVERPVSPHGLRHTFAMKLYRGTRDLLLVKEALGHRSISSTMVYVGSTNPQRRAV